MPKLSISELVSPAKPQAKNKIDLVEEKMPSTPLSIPARAHARPVGYGKWPLAKRMEHCFGLGLLNLELILSWDPLSLDDVRFRGWRETVTSILHVGAKFGLEAQRTYDAERLAEVRARLAAVDSARPQTQDVVRNPKKRDATKSGNRQVIDKTGNRDVA